MYRRARYFPRVAAGSQRRALAALFAALAVAFGGIAYAAATAGEWVIVAAAAAVGAWLASLAARGLRSR